MELPFTKDDVQLVKLVAECSAPTFNQILLLDQAQALLSARGAHADYRSDVFREEAMGDHIQQTNQPGKVLGTLPLWLRRAYWILVVLFFVALIAGMWLIPGIANMLRK